MSHAPPYGPYVVSDITHYADYTDLRMLLEFRFSPYRNQAGQLITPFTIQVSFPPTLPVVSQARRA
jgi:hypothetical protein